MNQLNQHLLRAAERQVSAQRLAIAMQAKATRAMRSAIEIDTEYAEAKRIKAEREGKA